jgi:hypothetical protein
LSKAAFEKWFPACRAIRCLVWQTVRQHDYCT